MLGRVISTKMAKTAVVLVERIATHPLYKKKFLRSKKYLVSDPLGVEDGDLVEIMKVAPVSKNKHFRIIKVVGKNLEEITEEKLKAESEKIVAEIMPEEKEGSKDKNQELSEKTKASSRNSEKKVVVDDSTVKTKSKKGGRTESSK